MAAKNQLLETSHILSSIGTLIRDARKQKELSQTDLGKRTNLNQKTISALENGSEGVEVRTLLKVFGELGIKINFALLGQDEPIYSTEDGKIKKIMKERLVGPEKEEVLSNLKKVSERLKKIGVTKLVLFGSTARGEAGPKSDIDIGFEVGGTPDIFTIGKIEDLIQDLFPYKVDLVRLKNLKKEVRATAEKDMIHVI